MYVDNTDLLFVTKNTDKTLEELLCNVQTWLDNLAHTVVVTGGEIKIIKNFVKNRFPALIAMECAHGSKEVNFHTHI